VAYPHIILNDREQFFHPIAAGEAYRHTHDVKAMVAAYNGDIRSQHHKMSYLYIGVYVGVKTHEYVVAGGNGVFLEMGAQRTGEALADFFEAGAPQSGQPDNKGPFSPP
jgi:hypothetical protein